MSGLDTYGGFGLTAKKADYWHAWDCACLATARSSEDHLAVLYRVHLREHGYRIATRGNAWLRLEHESFQGITARTSYEAQREATRDLFQRLRTVMVRPGPVELRAGDNCR